MAKRVKASCVVVALATGLLGATAARADDQDARHPFTVTQNFGFLTYRFVGTFGLNGALASETSGKMSYYPGVVRQIDQMSLANVGQDRQPECIGHHEDVTEKDRGIEGDVGRRHGKPARGRRHRPLGTGARNHAALGRSRDGQSTRDSSHFISIFSYAPGGTYTARSVSDANSSNGGHTYGVVSGNSGFAASSGASGGGFSGFSSGGSSRSSGGAPTPEVDTLLGVFIVGGTMAYIRRRRSDEAAAEAAAA